MSTRSWLAAGLAAAGVICAQGSAEAQEAERRAFKEAVIKAASKTPKARRSRGSSSNSKPGALPAQPAKTTSSSKSYDFSDGTVEGQLGSRQMRLANKVAAKVLEHRMRRKRPNDLLLIRQAAAADVVVVRGGYDRVQDVLRAVGVKHVVVPPRLLTQIPLMSTQTVMVNCPGRMGARARKKIHRFVKTGGYLVTTDWALSLVQRAFPGYIRRGGRNTKNDVVKVHVHDKSSPLLAHVKVGRGHPRWWLEGASYPIKVVDPKKVKVLISSREMRKRYGHGAVAVAFRYDDGKVLHMTSHFYLQQAKLVSKRERAQGSRFAAKAGLSADALKKLRASGLDKVRSGELNSAYSMQQVTANVIAGKARDNKRLLKRYKRRAKRGLRLQRQSKTKSKPVEGGGEVRKDYLLRVIKRKGKRVKVRDLFGREGWTDEANLL